ncbi:MAG: hypothetical protein ACJLS2_02340 [Microcella pacifica]
MTPVERLQAAIDKLETLRAESHNWRVQISSEDGPEVVHDFDTEGYGPGTGTLAWTITAEGAINIVTLHHTLAHYSGDLGISTNRHIVALASAILGVDS